METHRCGTNNAAKMGETKANQTFAKLKSQQSLLLKSCCTSLKAIKLCNPNFVAETERFSAELAAKRDSEKAALEQQVMEALSQINSLKMQLSERRNLSAERCRSELLAIQRKLSSLQEHVEKQTCILVEEQKLLEIEVTTAQRRLEESGETREKYTTPSRLKRTLNLQQHCKDQDVASFERLQAERGSTGGWDEADHMTFLRLRAQHLRKRGLDSFVTALQTVLPDVSAERIREHEDWHSQYDDLKTKFKAALERWRQQKQRVAAAPTEEPKPARDASAESCSRKKQQISEWKRQREAQQQALKTELLERQQKERERQMRERQKQAEQKATVAAYREQRRAEFEAAQDLRRRQLEQEKKEKAAQAKELLKTFRKLDVLHMERQRILREHAPHQLEHTLPRVAATAHAERDPSRLLQHTKVWQSHCEAKPSTLRPVLHLRNMPHLGVPDWRKDVF